MRDLIAFATLVQAIEDYTLRGELETSLPWAIVRDELPGARAYGWLFSRWGLTLLLAARVAASLALWFNPRAFDVAVLIFGTWAWGLRWRGSFNGGSDQMTMVVLIGSLMTFFGPAWERWGLILVAANVTSAFVIAGLAKLKNRDWRRGVAPAAFVEDAGWTRPGAPVAITLAWSTMAFEVLFPLAFVNPSWAPGFVGVSVVFHVANAYLFGLNRFLLAWAAAYPAVLALAQR